MGSSETTKEGHVMGTNEQHLANNPGWIIIILSKLGRRLLSHPACRRVWSRKKIHFLHRCKFLSYYLLNRSGSDTLTRSGSHILTRSGSHALTRSGSHALTRSGSHTLTRSGSYTLTRSGSHTLTRSGSHTLTRSESHTPSAQQRTWKDLTALLNFFGRIE